MKIWRKRVWKKLCFWIQQVFVQFYYALGYRRPGTVESTVEMLQDIAHLCIVQICFSLMQFCIQYMFSTNTSGLSKSVDSINLILQDTAGVDKDKDTLGYSTWGQYKYTSDTVVVDRIYILQDTAGLWTVYSKYRYTSEYSTCGRG